MKATIKQWLKRNTERVTLVYKNDEGKTVTVSFLRVKGSEGINDESIDSFFEVFAADLNTTVAKEEIQQWLDKSVGDFNRCR